MRHNGLLTSEINNLRWKYGWNSLPEDKPDVPIKIFLSQLTNPLVYLLLGASSISLLMGKYEDMVFMFLVVIINSTFGFFQEYKTQKTLQSIKKLIKPITTVIRDGERRKIDVSELLPGDLVVLNVGDKVPADGIVRESFSLLVNEAVLTGESEAQQKNIKDMLYMGTIIIGGRTIVEVKNIGVDTKMGAIAQTIKTTSEPLTTLQLRLERLTKTLIRISILLSLLTFGIGLLSGKEFWQIVQVSVVMLVAIIPEALIVVVTLILAIAMNKISAKKAIVRKLMAIETLGSTTIICTDKTGTLTEGKMELDQVEMTNKEMGWLTMCLCNDQADTIEVAMMEYVKKQKNFSVELTIDKHIRTNEIPFSSEHKFMATTNLIPGNSRQQWLLVKGAPEVLMGMSRLSKNEKNKLLNKVDMWAKQGQKVLALAYKKIALAEVKEIKKENISGLEWGGLVGLWDPPRVGAKEAIKEAIMAGVKVKVITGDYRLTASKIMDYLGIGVKDNEILDGEEIDKLNEKELMKLVEKVRLYSRVTPQQKLRIVEALQNLGEIVAMTGDGVNDAPALKKSNIGIVVGDASEVAKETADMVLIDSNFKTIVTAIEEGRVVYENIKKTIFFMLSNSFAEIILVVGAMILKWPLPLTVVQILWTHLLCDGPEDIVLGFEPKEKEVMNEGPKKINEPMVGKGALLMIGLISSLSGTFALGLFGYYGVYLGDLALGRTMAFMAIAFNSIFYILSCRTFRKPFWKYENFWGNKWLFGSMTLSIFLMTVITYVPPIQKLLEIAPLQFEQWGLLLSTAVITVIVIELSKIKLLRGN